MFTIYVDGKSIYNSLNNASALLDPKLTLELGKSGTLSFKIPAVHRYYSFMQELRTLVSVKMEDEEIFRGRVLTVGKDFNKTRAVDCEGDLAFLADTVVKSEKYKGSAHTLFRNLINAHNAMTDDAKKFVVGTISVEDRQVLISGESSEIEDAETGKFDYKQIAINATSGEWDTAYGRIESDLLAYIGGYLFTRRSGNTTYIDWLTENSTATTQEIKFGLNLVDIEEETAADELFTVLIPLGDDGLTVEKVNGGSKELVNQEAVQKYGRIVKTHSFDNVNNANTLLENGRRYLVSNCEVRTTYTIKAVDLHQLKQSIQPIRIGDKVKLVSEPHGLNDEMTCVKIEYDLTNPANTTYTFGNPKQTLTERYRKDKRNQASSYAGGSGAAASAVASQTDKKIESEASRLNAFVRLEAEKAQIRIGAIDKELQRVGINIDAGGNASETMDIYSLRKRVDEIIERSYDQNLQIKLVQDEDKAAIESVASEMYRFKEEYYGHKASITQAVDAASSKIDIVASSVEEDHNTLAQIELQANKDESYIKLFVEGTFGYDIDSPSASPEDFGRKHASAGILSRVSAAESAINTKVSYEGAYGAAEALLALYADKNGSNITLKADKVSLYGMTSVSNGRLSVSGGITSTGQIYAGSAIYSAGHIYEQASGDNTAVQLSNIGHRHKFTYNSTTGQIEIHNETYEGGDYFFNIADTQTYRDGVSAAWNNGAQTATVSDISVAALLSDANKHYIENGHHYVKLAAAAVPRYTDNAGTTHDKNAVTVSNLKIEADKVYTDGVADGEAKFTRVSTSSRVEMYEYGSVVSLLGSSLTKPSDAMSSNNSLYYQKQNGSFASLTNRTFSNTYVYGGYAVAVGSKKYCYPDGTYYTKTS